VPAPPATVRQHGVAEPLPLSECAHHCRERRLARRRSADIEHSAFVISGRTGQEAVPIVRTQKAPGRYGLDRYAFLAGPARGHPGFVEPAHLLLAGAAIMHLGDRYRDCVSGPGLAKCFFEAWRSSERAHCFDVDEPSRRTGPNDSGWIALDPVVEETVA